MHKYITGYQFHKKVMKWSVLALSFPIPLRKVTNPEDAIAHIDNIRNTKLEEKYNLRKEGEQGRLRGSSLPRNCSV